MGTFNVRPGYYVVEPSVRDNVTKSGFFVAPDGATQTLAMGRVIQCGAKTTLAGLGERIYFKPFIGHEVILGTAVDAPTVTILAEEDILGVLSGDEGDGVVHYEGSEE